MLPQQQIGGNEIGQALANMLGPYLSGIKASGTPAATAQLYTNGGLFGRCDGPTTVINAMVSPLGFESKLEWFGTNTENEFVDALKAITTSGSEQTTQCGDCITVGFTACAQHYCFGRFCRQSQELQFDRIGLHGNASVPVKALLGNVTDAAGNILLRQGEEIQDEFLLQSRGVGYALSVRNAQMLWDGNPCNNNGATNEYQGFQLLVNTGKVDSYTQLDCDSIDSFLMDFNFINPAATGTHAIRAWFQRMVQELKYRATRAGFDWGTGKMFIVMSPNMWNQIARVYACAGLDLCAPTGQARITASADQAQARHEDILRRQVLMVDGVEYEVFVDNMIPETTGQANGICSDIYFITTEISGELMTFGQYQDFNQTYGRTTRELRSLFGSDDIGITDNGRFAFVRDNSRGCFDVQILTKPRIVARAPWLMGRIQNVCADVLETPFPDVTGSGRTYEKNGGRSSTPIPILYGPCVNC